MRSLAILFFIYSRASIVTALAVPHLHPEESRIDISIKLAAANVPLEDDHSLNLNEYLHHWKGHDEIDEDYLLNQDDTYADIAEKSSFKKRDGNWLHEYDEISDFLEQRDASYVDETDEGEEVWRRSVEYIHLKDHGPSKPPDTGDGDSGEEIDTDNLSWKRNTPGENNGLLNECLWGFKKDDNCIEKNDQERHQRRDEDSYFESNDQIHRIFKRDGDTLDVGDEKHWEFKRHEGYSDGENYDPTLKQDEYYFNDGEEEYLRKRYEDYFYDRRYNYLPKGDLGSEAEADPNQLGSEWCSKEAKDGYSWQADEYEDFCNGGDHANGIGEYPYGTGEYILRTRDGLRDPPAENDYLCETTESSPTVVDVVEIAAKLIYDEGMLRCGAMNILGSNCMKLGELGSAQIGICSIQAGWFVYCADVGRYVLELSKRCKSEINGIWRVGGTIFHKDGKGSLIVY